MTNTLPQRWVLEVLPERATFKALNGKYPSTSCIGTVLAFCLDGDARIRDTALDL